MGDDGKPNRKLETIFYVVTVAKMALVLGALYYAIDRACSDGARDPQSGECFARGPSIGGIYGSGNSSEKQRRTASAGWGETGRSFGAAGGS